jgi:preprotein translocase subunit SecF
MKTKLTILAVLIVVGIILLGQIGSVVEVGSNERIEFREEPTVEAVVTPTDVIDEARKELERINAELDKEETQLLEDIKVIEAEAQAKVADKKTRLEKIRETRSSFQ